METPKIKRRNTAPVAFCHSILGLGFPVSEANENSSELLRVRPIAHVQLMPSIPSPSIYQGDFEKGAKAKLSPMAMQPWAKQLLNKSAQHQCSSARIYKNYVHKRYILGGELRINQEEKKEIKHRQSRVHSTGGGLRKINAAQWKMVTERGRKHSEASTNPSYEQAPHSSLWKQHHQLGTTCSNPRVCETQSTFKPWPTV